MKIRTVFLGIKRDQLVGFPPHLSFFPQLSTRYPSPFSVSAMVSFVSKIEDTFTLSEVKTLAKIIDVAPCGTRKYDIALSVSLGAQRQGYCTVKQLQRLLDKHTTQVVRRSPYSRSISTAFLSDNGGIIRGQETTRGGYRSSATYDLDADTKVNVSISTRAAGVRADGLNLTKAKHARGLGSVDVQIDSFQKNFMSGGGTRLKASHETSRVRFCEEYADLIALSKRF